MPVTPSQRRALTLRCRAASACETLVMIELSLAAIDDAVTGIAELEAIVDIVIADGEDLLVEAAKLEKQSARRQHRGRRHRGAIPCPLGESEITGIVAGQAPKRGETFAQAQHHAAMLHAAVGEQKPRADGADARQTCPSNHLTQPSRLDHRHVVIEKQNKLSIGLQGGLVVDVRIVERAGRIGNVQDLMRQRFEIGRGLRLVAHIVDDDNLVIPICRGIQRLQHTIKHPPIVLGGDQERHCWSRVGHLRSVDAVAALDRPARLRHAAGHPAPGKGLLQGTTGALASA